MKNKTIKNILCIRADNMGDVIMSTPALRALKETFSCKITLLTSSMGAGITPFVPFIDDTLIADLPWSRNENCLGTNACLNLIKELKRRSFDTVIIFTVYSQNPLPAAMLAYLSEIPLRLAYCRENPYCLLTHWIPEKEPYTFIRHQVKRDLELVASIGAHTNNEQLTLSVSPGIKKRVAEKLRLKKINNENNWIIFHAPVSEKRREYPLPYWINAGKRIADQYNCPILLTGSSDEKPLTDQLAKGIGKGAYSIAGLFSLEEFISLIGEAILVVSVNTGTIHIAAALQTPVIVLYALTNPQHTPWQVKHKVLSFPVPENMRSKNEVIQYVHHTILKSRPSLISPDQLVKAVGEFIKDEAKLSINISIK